MKRENARLNLCVARRSMYCKEMKREKMDKKKDEERQNAKNV
jgi:hypothetical protein